MAQHITPSVLDATYTGFDLRFQQGKKTAAPWYTRISTTVPSNTGSNTYAWLKSIPGYRKWVGERVFHSLVSKGTVLVNDDYENSISVPRNAVEDEQIGIFGASFEMMGMQAAKLPDKVLAKVLKEGNTTVHYDGQPFFHNSHPVDPDDTSKGTYSNNKTSFALTSDNYGASRAEMAALVDEGGNPMGLIPDLLVVPPQLEDTAKRILSNDYLGRAIGSAAASDNNIHKGTADWLMIPELADQPDVWYLLVTKLPIRPFIFQDRKAPTMFPKVASTDPNVLLHKEFWYLSDARCAGGYAFPFLGRRHTA